MPIQTDLNSSPYFDDYNEKSDYYKVLFRPGVAVQVRELNQLQTLLQKQIETFGDNVFKRGAVVHGCNYQFHKPLPYVKIGDLETDGTPVNVSAFKGYLAKNTSNLVSQIVETSTGFEATAPDLNTLHVKYLNHGSSGKLTAYIPGEVLTIYDPQLSIPSTIINVKSSGFSNTDVPVFLSAIEVQNSTGGQNFVNATGQACTFSVGEIITQDVSGALAEIREVNATAKASTLILKIRPLASQLRIGNTDSWSFLEGYQFTSSSSKISANLTNSIGQDATGTIVTDVNGGVIACVPVNKGKGYYVEPYVTVKYSTPNTSPSANSLIDALSITAENYLAKCTVNASADAIGSGLGFSVGEGTLYQKGYFTRVEPQFIVVEKYSTLSEKIVCFQTQEEIVQYTTDQTLLDNATGTYNINAPGANRLKLTPKLEAHSPAEAATLEDCVSLVEFRPIPVPLALAPRTITNVTVTNVTNVANNTFVTNVDNRVNIANNTFVTQITNPTIEKTISSENDLGNYVIDEFLLSSQSYSANSGLVTGQFLAVIDPGLAHIDNQRVNLPNKTYVDIDSAYQTTTKNVALSLDYGNYIIINELGGYFKFSVGATISLRDTAKTYLTSYTGAAISVAGSEIGVARIRSIVLDSGVPGTPTAKYRLYLFDIRMNIGKNFSQVLSVFYDGSGTSDGIGDVVFDSTGSNGPYNPAKSSLIFDSGTKPVKAVRNISYTYRTVNDTLSIANSGTISISVAANPGEFFPYPTTLSSANKVDILVVPLANAYSSTDGSGTVTATGSGNTITGTSTKFDTDFRVGDYIRIANSTAGQVKRISGIASNTSLSVTGTIANSYTGVPAKITLAFPQFVPIAFNDRDYRTVSVSANTTMVINIGNTIGTSVSAAVTYNVQRTTPSISKTVTRKSYVKINTNTNVANSIGPWCLGIPDIIRLRNVYLGNSSAVTTSDTNVTSNFYIDHNQRKDYYDVGFLYKKSNYTVSDSIYLMAEFDVLTTTQDGLKTVSSYPINDSAILDNNTAAINTLEIPEMYHDNDKYYDIRDVFDFRPYSSNTATITADQTLASTNPIEPTQLNRFNIVNDKKFPAPGSSFTATLDKYMGRIDAVMMYANATPAVIKGKDAENPKPPGLTREGMLINYLVVPPYPSIPQQINSQLRTILDRKIASIKYTKKREIDHVVSEPIGPDGLKFNQPKRYTMAEIGQLERRIADLEYYTSLSFSENALANETIKSSVNPTSDRFKFGFFVDDFTTLDFVELQNPNQSATIQQNMLQPKTQQIKINYKFNQENAQTYNTIKGEKGATHVDLLNKTKTLVSQDKATEPTTVSVAVTQTITSTTGTEVATTRTIIREITTTEYQLLTGTQQVVDQANPIKITKIADGIMPKANQDRYASGPNVVLATFTCGKLPGLIHAEGGRQKSSKYAAIYRKKTDGTWVEIPQLFTLVGGNNSWKIEYNHTLKSGYTNDYKITGSNTGGDSNGAQLNINLTSGYYPQTSEEPNYINQTTYSIDTTRNSTNTTELIPSSTVVENTQTITKSLFNSKMTASMEIDKLFAPPATLNSPFIDLAAAIRSDIDSNK
jgi:hypothetical protein